MFLRKWCNCSCAPFPPTSVTAKRLQQAYNVLTRTTQSETRNDHCKRKIGKLTCFILSWKTNITQMSMSIESSMCCPGSISTLLFRVLLYMKKNKNTRNVIMVHTQHISYWYSGLRSDGIDAPVSACPLAWCGSYQFLFPCLELLGLLVHLVWSSAMPHNEIVPMSTTFVSLLQTSLYSGWLRQVFLLPNASSA